MPSPAARSAPAPSSTRVTCWPPGWTVTTTLPLGLAQLMLSAERSTGVPTELVTAALTGRSREYTGAVEQLKATGALGRFCVAVAGARPGVVVTRGRVW